MSYFVKRPVTKMRRLAAWWCHEVTEAKSMGPVFCLYAILALFALILTCVAAGYNIWGQDEDFTPWFWVGFGAAFCLGVPAFFIWLTMWGEEVSVGTGDNGYTTDEIAKGALAHSRLDERLKPQGDKLYDNMLTLYHRYEMANEPQALYDANKRAKALVELEEAGRKLRAAKIEIPAEDDVITAQAISDGMEEMRQEMLPPGDWSRGNGRKAITTSKMYPLGEPDEYGSAWKER